MRKTLIISFLFMLSSHLAAQKTQDVLYLRDGSIIRGSIVEKNDTLIRILTYGSNVFAYAPDQVIAIAHESVPKQELFVKDFSLPLYLIRYSYQRF